MAYNPAETAQKNAEKDTKTKVREAKTAVGGQKSATESAGGAKTKYRASTALQTDDDKLALQRKVEKGTMQEKHGVLGAMGAAISHGIEDVVKANTGKDIGSRKRVKESVEKMEAEKTTPRATPPKKEAPTTGTSTVADEAKEEPVPPKESSYDEKYGKKYGISKETWDSMNDVEKSRILDREAYKGRGLDVARHILGSLGNGMAAFSGAQQNYNPEDFMNNTKKKVGERSAEESRQRQQESIKKQEDLGISKELAKYTSDLSTESAKELANLSAANQKDLANFMADLDYDQRLKVNDYLKDLPWDEAMKIGFAQDPTKFVSVGAGILSKVPSDEGCKSFAIRKVFN